MNSASERSGNIILIGMSGAGKTHWSRELAKHLGVEHVEFDELIGNSDELEQLISSYPGKDEAEKMGRYFGMPWTEGFQGREDQFLGIERGMMQKYENADGVLLDMTGSAIYHPEQMERIAQTGVVVYLQTSEAAQKQMFENFIKEPKPVCWGGAYEQQQGESEEEALERCYPILLDSRAKMYKEYADVTLPSDVHKNIATAEQLIEEIRKRLSGQQLASLLDSPDQP